MPTERSTKRGSKRGGRGRSTRDDQGRPIDGRTALLDAACRSIARKGLRGLRIEEVAGDAGVAPSLIYYHFGDRATLLRSALEHVGEKAATYTEAERGTSGREAVLESLAAEIQDDAEIRDNSAAWGEFRDLAVFDHSLRPALTRSTRRWIDDVARLIRRGQEDGSIPADLVPEEAAQQLTAMTEGLSTRWLAGLLTTAEARSGLREAVERYLGPHPR
jgi:AcrR family transcriptional regulator